MKMNEPILITGCARSGTSITAGVIHYCGAFGGKLTGATRYNKKGQFENNCIRDSVIKPYLVRNGWDRLGQNPIPENIDEVIIESHFRKRITSIFKNEGYKGGPWFYKGAKMCIVWTQWHNAFPNAKWIIVRRKDKEIINSCLKTGFMKAYRDSEGWQKWIDTHKRRFDEMIESGLDVKEVWPSKIIKGDFEEIKGVIDYVGLEWNEDIIKNFIEPRLWHKVKK